MNRRLFLKTLVFGAGTALGGMSGYHFRQGWSSAAGIGSDVLALPPGLRPAAVVSDEPPVPPTTALVFHPSYLLYIGPPAGSVREGPNRLEAIMDQVRQTAGLKELPLYLPTPATNQQLTAVHDAGYVAEIRAAAVLPQNEMAFVRTIDPATRQAVIQYFGRTNTPYALIRPYQAASLSAGGAVMAVDLVMTGQAPNAFALLRPPGHHAKIKGYRGFCVFNNAAVAARHAQHAYGAKKILIIDWDVHHGNGTQQIFYDDPNVLYFSVHQSGIYPRTGHIVETGAGRGIGRTINVPLPGGMGDHAYRTVFDTILAPAAKQFKPDLIIVSAGQDAHAGEHLAQMQVSDFGYAHLATVVKDWADDLCHGKLVLLLEGGYNPRTAASSVCAVLQALRGGPGLRGRPPVDPTSDRLLRQELDRVISVQKRFWPLMAKAARAT